MNQPLPTAMAFSSAMNNYIHVMREKAMRGEISKELHDDNLRAIIEAMQDYQDEIKKFPAGSKRAIEINRAAEKIIQASKSAEPDLWKKVTCRAGCNHCCHIMIDITTDEAELLVTLIEQNQASVDLEKLKVQAGWEPDPDKWYTHPKAERACVFLKNGLCSVYKHRPLNCRKYYVISDPELCNGPSGGKVQIVMENEVEVLASAAQDLDRQSMGENLPRLLLKTLLRRQVK